MERPDTRRNAAFIEGAKDITFGSVRRTTDLWFMSHELILSILLDCGDGVEGL